MKQFIEEDWDSPSGNGHENIKLYYKKKKKSYNLHFSIYDLIPEQPKYSSRVTVISIHFKQEHRFIFSE